MSPAITPGDTPWTIPTRDSGAARSAATPTNVIETLLSIRGQKKTPQEPKKGTCQTPWQEVNARGVS